jgi:hypothetical protein
MVWWQRKSTVSITQEKSKVRIMLFHAIHAVNLFSETPFITWHITYVPQVQDTIFFPHTWTCQRLKLHKPVPNLLPNNPRTTEHQNSILDDTSCFNSGSTECCWAVSTELKIHRPHIMMSLPHLKSLNIWGTCCVFCPRSATWHWWSSATHKFNYVPKPHDLTVLNSFSNICGSINEKRIWQMVWQVTVGR